MVELTHEMRLVTGRLCALSAAQGPIAWLLEAGGIPDVFRRGPRSRSVPVAPFPPFPPFPTHPPISAVEAGIVRYK